MYYTTKSYNIPSSEFLNYGADKNTIQSNVRYAEKED